MDALPVRADPGGERFLPSGTETILVVDDDPLVTLVATRALRQLGYDVLNAGNGQEAVTQATEYPRTIDLLLADVVMPRMTGPEAASRLRKSRPNIRVIYTSGYTLEADELGGGAFILKPFTISELACAVREALDGGASLAHRGPDQPASPFSRTRRWLSHRSQARRAPSEQAGSIPSPLPR